MFKQIWMWIKNLFTRKPKSGQGNYFDKLLENSNAKPFFKSKVKVSVGSLVRKTPCGHHAWYNSNIGIIRKPIQ